MDLEECLKTLLEHRRLQENFYLSSLTIILVLASESLVFESIQYLANGFCGFGKHGFQRYPWCKFTSLSQPVYAHFYQGGDHFIVAG